MVDILDLYEIHLEIFGQVLCHFRGKRCDENTLTAFRAYADLAHKVIHLTVDGTYLNLGVNKTRRAYELLRYLYGVLLFVVGGGGADVNYLIYLAFEFVEEQRPVIECGGQTEAVVYEIRLSRSVAAAHTLYLRERNV